MSKANTKIDWNPVKVKYDAVCDTKEQFELFADFLMEMKALKESKKTSEWDGECQCGHKHSDHHPISSHNYTAGHCTIGECRCKHFIHNPK